MPPATFIRESTRDSNANITIFQMKKSLRTKIKKDRMCARAMFGAHGLYAGEKFFP
jgi:hypothetical protein